MRPSEPDDRIGVVDLVAAAEGELDVLPVDARIPAGGAERFGAHLDRRLGTETAEGVESHADDRHVVHHPLLHGSERMHEDLGFLLVTQSDEDGSTSMPNLQLARVASVSRASTRTTSPSWTRPTP